MVRSHFNHRAAVAFVIASLCAGSLLAEGKRAGASPQEGASKATTRQERAQYLYFFRDAASRMIDSGEAKVSADLDVAGLPEPGPAPKLPHTKGPGHGQMDGLARFLRNAAGQSLGKSYKDAYDILKRALTNARTAFGTLPEVADACLLAALRAGAKVDSYADGWEILYLVAKDMGDNPSAFEMPGWGGVRNALRMARKAHWEKSFENAYHGLSLFLQTILERCDMGVVPEHCVAAIEAAVAAGKKADEYDDGWRIQDKSMSIIAQSRPSTARQDYFRAALEGSYDNSFRNGYFTLLIWSERLLQSGLVGSLEAVTLETSVGSAKASDSYAGGFKILRDGIKSLLR